MRTIRSIRRRASISLVWLLALILPLQALAQPDPPAATRTVDAGGDSNIESVQPLADRYLDALAQTIADELSPQDRIGQLFLVNFAGSAIDADSDIARLIHEYRIGGVVLSPAYGNFTNARTADTPADVAALSNRLQALAFGKALPENVALGPFGAGALALENLPSLTELYGGDVQGATGIPLWIAVEQLGDTVAATSLRHRFTPLPNQMTLGATWDAELTGQIGAIVGEELAAVGVNMLLGPSLDVYAEPRPDSVGALGVYSFSGDAFWVSQLGKAYIGGVHRGSGGRIATAARHFPGIGSVDRLPQQEVATIQSDVERMRQESLPPFVAVTSGAAGVAPAPAARTDVLMSSHMRYSAFQPATGGPSAAPLGFSPALSTLIEQEGLNAWHATRGLLMTNALGLPAIRRVYLSDSGEFAFRRAALDAFTAGNDLIYLGMLGDDGTWADELGNIQETVLFFQDRYREDPGFALQVDDAARRIVRAKLARYLTPDDLLQAARRAGLQPEVAAGAPVTATNIVPTPTPTRFVLPTPFKDVGPTLADLLISRSDLLIFDEAGDRHADASSTIRQVARDAITILYPDPLTVGDALPPPIQSDKQIVIFTDSRLVKECADCLAEVTIGPEEIADVIDRFYGPDATDQVGRSQLNSHTFAELAEVLDASAATGDDGQIEPIPEMVAAAPSAQSTPIVTATAAASASIAPADTIDDGTGSSPSAAETPTIAASVSATAALSDVALGGFSVRLPRTNPTQAASGPTARIERIEREIEAADWILFAMLNVDPDAYPSSNVVKRFLRQRSEQIEEKEVIVLALNAPYFLDATEISQLTTYLAAYSHAEPFVESAVRTLFRSIVPSGAPPVSVAGTRFSNLQERLNPDARVQMPLRVLVADEIALDTARPDTDSGQVQIGDSMTVEVGPIVDYNGNLVPDGVEVAFQIAYENAEGMLNVEPAITRGGMASRELLIPQGGTLLISAASREATTGPPVAVTMAPAVPFESDAIVITGAAEAVAAGGSPEGIAESAGPGEADVVSNKRVTPLTLALALFVILITLSLLLIVQIRTLPRAALVYNMLWAVIVGLAAYVLYGLGLLPGSQWLQEALGVWAAGAVVFIGMILPLLWLQLRLETLHIASRSEMS